MLTGADANPGHTKEYKMTLPSKPAQPQPQQPKSVLPNSMHAFVASRDKAYDNAWLKTSEVMRLLEIEKTTIWQTPYSFAWQMILNKLIRAMATPENKDHWLDSQGYCQLVLEELEKIK